MTTGTEVIPELPAWIVWDELTAREQATLTRMWNESLDRWLEWALDLPDKLPPNTFNGVWWNLDRNHTRISRDQLEELRRTPPGEERRECLMQIFADRPGSTTQ